MVKNKRIFTPSQEQQLVDYILYIYTLDIYFDLSPKKVRICFIIWLTVTQFRCLRLKIKLAGED